MKTAAQVQDQPQYKQNIKKENREKRGNLEAAGNRLKRTARVVRARTRQKRNLAMRLQNCGGNQNGAQCTNYLCLRKMRIEQIIQIDKLK